MRRHIGTGASERLVPASGCGASGAIIKLSDTLIASTRVILAQLSQLLCLGTPILSGTLKIAR
jgi:hypothetical protein